MTYIYTCKILKRIKYQVKYWYSAQKPSKVSSHTESISKSKSLQLKTIFFFFFLGFYIAGAAFLLLLISAFVLIWYCIKANLSGEKTKLLLLARPGTYSALFSQQVMLPNNSQLPSLMTDFIV
jgi:hypothetical protein